MMFYGGLLSSFNHFIEKGLYMLRTGMHILGTVYRNPDDIPFDGFMKLKNAGFDTVDFNFEIFHEYDSLVATDGSCFYDRSIPELKSFFEPYKRAAEECSLELFQAHAPFHEYPEGDEAALSHILEVQKKVIALAGWMKIPYLVIHPFELNNPHDKAREKVINTAFFSKLAPYAREAGVIICLENLFITVGSITREGVCANPYEAVLYIDELNREADEERFGFCFDIGHAAMLGSNIYEFLMMLGPRLKVLHLHENDCVNDQHGIPFTHSKYWCGESSTDWESLIMGLRDIHYSGSLNFETGSSLYTAPEALGDAVRTFTHEIGIYLAKKIGG